MKSRRRNFVSWKKKKKRKTANFGLPISYGALEVTVSSNLP